MKSCLYSCKIHHHRSRPKVHRFSYRLFMFCLDLDDLENLLRNPLISRDRGNIYTLSVSDHLQFGAESIKENLANYLKTQGITQRLGRVRLLTHLRTFGHQFNPVSFYFVEDQQERALAVVAEVANTYNEQKLFLLGPEQESKPGVFRSEQRKEFYISPFSDLDTQFHFMAKFPEEKISLTIDQADSEGIYFKSGILGRQVPLTTWNLAVQTIRFPFITFQVIFAIHWHALILFLKKIPVRRKKDRPDLQTHTRTYLQRGNLPHHQSQI